MLKTYDEVTDRIERAIDGTDWRFNFYNVVSSGEASFILENWSPSGEDLPIEGFVTSPESAMDEITEELRRLVRDYDVDEHVELWISGRGENGVPSTVRELLEDAEDIGEMYRDLYKRVKKEACHA